MRPAVDIIVLGNGQMSGISCVETQRQLMHLSRSAVTSPTKNASYISSVCQLDIPLPRELDFVRPVASPTGNQESERSWVNVLSAFPDLMRRTRYLSTCRQLLTLKLSSVYLNLTSIFTTAYYYSIAFIVHVSMTMLRPLDYCVS